MVRLKVTLTSAEKGTFNVFQFHNGTIKSRRVGYSQALKSLFQFHNGTIKNAKLCE